MWATTQMMFLLIDRCINILDNRKPCHAGPNLPPEKFSSHCWRSEDPIRTKTTASHGSSRLWDRKSSGYLCGFGNHLPCRYMSSTKAPLSVVVRQRTRNSSGNTRNMQRQFGPSLSQRCGYFGSFHWDPAGMDDVRF